MTPASVAVLWRAEETRKTPPRLGPLWGYNMIGSAALGPRSSREAEEAADG